MSVRVMFCGEALIDFITTDGQTYRATPGGSPCNASKAAARAGANAGFCGVVSTDLFGQKIMEDLANYGVDTSLTPRSDDPTVLGFVQISEENLPLYAFFDRESAMVNMAPALPAGELGVGDVLCVGSISLIAKPGADAIADFALAQRSAGAVLALDPNVRPGMISAHPEWRPRMDKLMDNSDIIKASSEDLEYYCPEITPSDFAAARLAAGASLVFVTDGSNGATGWTHNGKVSITAPPVSGGDTVGAGDTFFGYALKFLSDADLLRPHRLQTIDDKVLLELLTQSTAAAALNCSRLGCDPPHADEVEAFITQQK